MSISLLDVWFSRVDAAAKLFNLRSNLKPDKGDGEQKQPVSEQIIKYHLASVWLSEHTVVGRTRGTTVPRKRRREQRRPVKNSQTHHSAEQSGQKRVKNRKPQTGRDGGGRQGEE